MIITRTAGLAGRPRVVLFSLVVCWVLIPAPGGHVAAGVALLVAVLAHLLVRRARWRAGRSAGQHVWSRRRRLVRPPQFTRAASSSEPAG